MRKLILGLSPTPPPPEWVGTRWLLEVVALLALVLGIAAVLRAWPDLPATVPMHFDLAGRPDGWGSRKALLLLPGVSIFLYVLLSLVQRLPASWYNYPVAIDAESLERQHRLARGLIVSLKAAIMGLFAHLALAIVDIALDRSESFGPWLVAGWLVVIFGLVAVYLIRARRAR